MKTTAGLEIKHDAFAKPPLHIPNGKGEPYKTELVEQRDPDGETIKWNFWHLRDDDRAPHNHPWDFTSTIVHGGYSETCFWVDGDGKVQSTEYVHVVGDVFAVNTRMFHIVTKVLPGTVTRMVCGKAKTKDNEWGYLDTATGLYSRALPDLDFLSRLRALNPFLANVKK